MDVSTFLIVIVTFVAWGVSSFISKLATNRIGERAVFWDMIGYAPVVITLCLIVFKLKDLIQTDKMGIGLAFLSGAIGSFGLIGWYFLITRGEVSTMVPLTALYPALTAILAIIFLHETVTPIKLLGITFSLVAIYLLSR